MVTFRAEGSSVREGGRWVRPTTPNPIRRRLPPVERQHDQADCGPAALLSVLRYWGGAASLPFVRDRAGTTLRGTGLVGLRSAAQDLGFRATAVTGSYDELALEPLPCIVHLLSEDARPHFVVVFRVDPGRIRIGDPSGDRRWLTRKEFEELWRARVALRLEPSDRLLHAPPPGWLPWIAGVFVNEQGWLLQAVFLGSVSAGLGLGTALFVQWLVDRFIPEGNSGMILATGAVLVLTLLLRALSGWLRHRFLLGVNRRVSVRLNMQFLGHLLRLPVRFFESRAVGDVTARLGDGVRIQTAVLEIVGTGVIDGMILLGSFVFLFLLAPELGWLAAGVIPPYALLLILSVRRLREAQTAARSSWGAAEASLVDTLHGIRAILSYGVGDVFARTNGRFHQAFQDRAERLGRMEADLSLLTEVAGGLLVVVALVFGALLAAGGELGLGAVMAGYSLLAGIIPSLHRLVGSMGSFQEASVSASRVRDLLLAPADPEEGNLPFTLDDGGLRLEGAVFEWPSGERPLDGVDLTFSRGQVTGIFGANGSGKTTLLAILSRTRPLTAGRMTIAGLPAESVSPADWRKAVALVPTEVSLFRGTLAENVLLGRADGDPLPELTAVESRVCPGFANRFPAGWDTGIGEGARRLSTGERQAVGFLRAFLVPPRLLLVDEGLHSADGELSRTLMRALLEHGRNHAAVVVSHDPEVLLRTDRVLVFHAGRIVREGPPSTVLRKRAGPGESSAVTSVRWLSGARGEDRVDA